MSSSSDEIRSAILDTVWTIWAEAGVSGWRRASRATAIDIEPLIVFTTHVGQADPRLRDEATDWCIRYGQLVSKVRLKNVLKLGLAGASFDEFAATVNAYSTLSWPTTASRPRRFSPSLKSKADLSRATLLQLRARAIFGVAARAEILALYAMEPAAILTLSQLAERIHFGRRITVDAAEALSAARILRPVEGVPARAYALLKSDELRALLAPMPERTILWTDVFVVLSAVWDIALSNEKDQMLRAVDTAKRLTDVDRSVFRASLPHVPKIDPTEDGWTRFTEWARLTVRQISAAL